MDLQAEKKYSALKKKLDSLYYCQPFYLDSMPLVESLLNDLLKTMEGFQQLKDKNVQLEEAVEGASNVALESEVTRLLKQNNELHLSVMNLKELTDSKDSKWRAALKKLEGENSDLKFLLDKQKSEFCKVERLSSNLKKKVATSNEKFELPRVLQPGSSTFIKVEENWADALRKADDRTIRVQQELEFFKNRTAELEKEADKSKELVRNRDREIDRLSFMVSAGPSIEAVNARHKHEQDFITIQSLNDKLNFLVEENRQFEEENVKAKEALSQFFKLEKANKNTLQTMDDLKRQNTLLRNKLSEIEKKSAPGAEEVGKLNVEKKKLLEKNRSLQIEIQKNRQKVQNAETMKKTCFTNTQAIAEELAKNQSETEQLKAKLADLENKKQEYESKLKDNNEHLTSSNAQIAGLRNELENVNSSFRNISNQHLEATEEIYRLKRQIGEVERQKNLLVGELEKANFELERAYKAKRLAEEQLVQSRKEELQLEADRNEGNRHRMQIESSQHEIQTLKEEISYLNKLREKDKAEILEGEERAKSLQNEVKDLQHHLRVAQKEIAGLSDDLQEKLTQVRSQSSSILKLEQELSELQPFKSKCGSLSSQFNESSQQVSMLKEEVCSLRKKQLYLEQELQSKTARIDDLQDLLNIAKHDKSVLQERYDDLESQNDQISKTAAENLRREVKAFREQIQAQESSEISLKKSLESAKDEVSRLQEKLYVNERELIRSNSLREDLEIELKQAKEQAFVSPPRPDEQFKTEELSDQLAQEQQIRQRLDDQLKYTTSSLESEKLHVQRLTSQNNQLKELVENLTSQKSNNEAVQEEIHVKDTEIMRLENAVRDLETQLEEAKLAYSDQFREMQELKAPDTSILVLQNKLKSANSELSAIRTQLEYERQKYNELVAQKSPGRGSEESVHEQLQRAREDIINLEMELQRLREEGGKSQHQLSKAEHTIKDLSRTRKYE